jgi:predicted Mrr-cat superfamily restriction endonuclease
MGLWLVRGGRDDIFVAPALKHQVAIIGFQPLGSIADVTDRKELRARVAASRPDKAAGTVTKWTNEIWSFHQAIKTGDRILMPYRNAARVWMGRWGAGEYAYREDICARGHHVHPVQWEADLAREELDDEVTPFLMRRATVICADGASPSSNFA